MKGKSRRSKSGKSADPRKRYLVISATIFGIAFLLFSIWKLLESPIFAVTQVQIQGNAALRLQQVELLSGVKRGDNIVKLSKTKVREGVRRSPWAASVAVEKHLPGTLIIKVKERIPAAIFFLGNRYHLVDGEGHILWADIKPSGYRLPLVVALPGGSKLPGARFEGREVREVLALVAGLDPALKSQLINISAPQVDRITLALKSGVGVMFGDADQMREKNFAAKGILADAGQRGEKLRLVDVRTPALSTAEPFAPPPTHKAATSTSDPPKPVTQPPAGQPLN